MHRLRQPCRLGRAELAVDVDEKARLLPSVAFFTPGCCERRTDCGNRAGSRGQVARGRHGAGLEARCEVQLLIAFHFSEHAQA